MRGREILADFDAYLPKFKKIIPNDYQKMMVTVGKLEERGMSHEAAKLEAFYLARSEGGTAMGKATGFIEYDRQGLSCARTERTHPRLRGV